MHNSRISLVSSGQASSKTKIFSNIIHLPRDPWQVWRHSDASLWPLLPLLERHDPCFWNVAYSFSINHEFTLMPKYWGEAPL